MKAKQDFVTAEEACNILGVKAQTLYSYVSRGLIQVRIGKDRRESLYPRGQIETLKARSQARSGHGPTAASAMRFGEPILESAITLIQDQKIYYRGYAINQLIETVAELLWSGSLARTRILWSSNKKKFTVSRPSTVDSASSISRMFLHEIAHVALEDPGNGDESLDLAVARARSLIQHTAKSLSGCERILTSTSVAGILATALGTDAEFAVSSLSHALIVSADHELNASTFAARIAAGTGADLYSCFMAGFGAFAGPKHGVSPIYVYQFMEECFRAKSAKQIIATHLQRRKMIPGFGHPIYLQAGDPRALILLASVRSLRPHLTKPARTRLDQLEQFLVIIAESDVGFPNLDLGLAALVWVLGLPSEWSAGLFAIGRMAGWTAHILEQRQQEFLLRPRARYTGRAPIETPSL